MVQILGATQWIRDKTGINLTVFRVIMLILLPIFPKMVLSFYLILGLYVQVSQPAKCRNCGIPLISHETTCSHCGMPRTVAIDMRFIGIFIVILGITIALSFFPAIGLGKYIQIKIPRYAGSVDDFSQPTPLPPQTPTTNQQNQQSNAQPNVPVTPTPEVPVPQTPPQQEAAPEIVIDDSTKVFFDPSGLNTQYSDSFELGLRWGKFGLGERNRTQDIVNQGEYAVKINGTETGVVFDIGQLLSNTIFVCHMYDGGNMTEQSYCGVSVNQTLALNRTILLGVAQKGSQYYSYFDPFGSLWVTTKVPRKEGWNKLTIETNGILNYLYINDELVGEIDTYTHWRYPFMINYGAGVAYFDDVGVYQRQKVSGIELSSSRDLTNYALNKKVSAACELMSNENMSMVKNLSRITNGIYNFDAIVPPPLNDSRYEYVQINACSNPKCVTVDMGQVFTLKNVVAYNWPRMLNLQNMTMRENIIQISKDAITWRTVFNFSSQGDYPTFNGPQKISFTTPKDAQYVRQCIDGNLLDGNSTWFQIEAWG